MALAEAWSAEAAARWIAEAVESGDPLAALPAGIAPPDRDAAEEVAAAVLEGLGLTPCGLRLLRRPGGIAVAGPMLEARLLPSGAPVATAALRHAAITAAVVGVLAAPLDPDEDAPPRLLRLHPALDVAASRFTAAPEDALALTADLAALGFVVAGKGRAAEAGPLNVALGRKGSRPRGVPVDLAAAFAEAAAAARRWGGLPAGALLVVAGLTPPRAPEGTLRASLGALGAAEAAFA
jgi:hypothetical protein